MNMNRRIAVCLSYSGVVFLAASLAAAFPAAVFAQGTGHIAVAENFSFTGPLQGQGGGYDIAGYWSSNWFGDPTFQFQTTGGYVQIGDFVGQTHTISRDFNMLLGHSPYHPIPGDPLYFSVELTEVIDNNAAYELALAFSEGGSTTVRFGFTQEENEAAKLFAQLNNLPRVYSPMTLVPNTPYSITGSLEFNVDLDGNERLTLWANASYQDYAAYQQNGTPNYALQTLGDLGVLTLGSRVTIEANTNEHLKLIDDLLLTYRFENANPTRFDLGKGNSPQPVQDGYHNWDLNAANPFQMTINREEYGLFGFSMYEDITMTFTKADGNALTNDNIMTFSAAAASTVAGLLTGDGIAAEGGIRLRFQGLTEDPWILKVFHHAPTDPETDILVAVGNPSNVVQTITPSFGNALIPAHSTILFHADGINDVDIYFLPSVANGLVPINGFTIVPEPSSWLLAGFGLAAVLAFAWRHRRRSK